jgi:hypothetical protein
METGMNEEPSGLELMEWASSFLARLKQYMPTSDDAVYINIISCEFIKYHFPNYKRRPIIFLIRLTLDLLFVKKYTHKILQEDVNLPILTIDTNGYIYRDNIHPLVSRLSLMGIDSMKLSKYFKRRSFNFYFFIDILKLIKYILKNNLKIKIQDLIPFFYYNLILVRYVDHIRKSLELLNLSELKVVISADPCDLFNRVVISYFKNKNVKTLVLQTGPTDFDSCEWEMSNAHLLCCWLESEDYFKKAIVNYKVFFPPRFYYTLDKTNHLKDFDLFIFLTWTENSEMGKKIKNSMIESINCISGEFKGRVGLKFHPAQKLAIPEITNKIKIVDVDVNPIEIIARSHKVVNFGSTTTYDCIYQQVSVGIINFAGQLAVDSIFFKLDDNVKVLKNASDFITFINHPNDVPQGNNLNNSAYKESLVENYIYEELCS